MTASQKSGSKLAVGLDVGTTKICAIVGKEERGKITILAVGVSPSAGLRKGVVVDADLAVSSIQRAIRDASEKAGRPIRSAYVGIAGGHIKGFSGSGAIAIKNREVRLDDVERLMDAAGAVYVPVERDILHVIPAGFRLDGLNGITDPIGMQGELLEANVHIVTGSVASVRNLIACCTRAGVDVLDILLEPLASAEAVLGETERNKGTVLVDIGGGTTDMALYRDGVLRHTAVLAIGGDHLTNDIAVGLGVTAGEAEKIKKAYGCASPGMVDSHESLSAVIDLGGGEAKTLKIPLRHLSEIIRARCEEFLGLVRKEVVGVPFALSKAAVVLTGGTSLLRGIGELAGEIFGTPVKIGIPEGVTDGGLVRSPIYATGVGLVRYGLSRYYHDHADFEAAGVFERMRKWVNGFFR
ncbi:MAG TPA: cell division protein FtsA [Thermodesulfovibrionales bacterium]|nr:cell division protein FtsA [Thermodesulfovibrionales bacterium]